MGILESVWGVVLSRNDHLYSTIALGLLFILGSYYKYTVRGEWSYRILRWCLWITAALIYVHAVPLIYSWVAR